MSSTRELGQTRLTAAAIIHRDDDRFLFVEEKTGGRTVLNQPSGGWEVGETLVQTSIREAAEEAGVLFEPISFLGTFITHHVNDRGVQICSIRAAFAGNILPGVPGVPLDGAIIRTHWFSYDEVMAHREKHRSSAVKRCLDAYRNGQLWPVDSLNEADDGV